MIVDLNKFFGRNNDRYYISLLLGLNMPILHLSLNSEGLVIRSISYRHRDLSRVFPSFIIVPCHGSPNSFTRFPKPLQSPLFTRPYGQPFSKSFFVIKMRELLLNAGISTIGYSGHSLRKGAAVTADRNGISKHDIKLLGRWKSDAVDVYINECQKPDHIKKLLLLNSRLLSSTLH